MKHGDTWMIPAAVALAVVLRLTAALGFGQSPLILHPVLDDLDYRSHVVRAGEGTALERALPRGSALYPRLAAMVPGVAAGGTRPLAVAQTLCEVGTVLLLVLLVRRRWGRAAAAAAALLYAIDPLGSFFAARFSPVAPATLAFTAMVFLWDRERGRATPSLPLSLGVGLLAGIGFLLMPLPFALLLALRLRDQILAARRQGARAASASILLPLLFLPAFAAGLLAYHARLPGGGPALSWGAGVAIDRAFDPATGGTPRFLKPPAWIPDQELRRHVWEELGRQGTEIDLYRSTASRGARRAIENPLPTLGVLLSKAAATLGAWPIPDALSPSFVAARSLRPFVWLAWSFAWLLGLGAAGFLLLRGDALRDTLAQALLAVALASILGMASAASRQAALPMLAALGGGWIAGAAGRNPDRFRRAPVTALGIALVVSLATGLLGPARALRNPSEDLRLLASTFEQTLNWRQAVPVLEEAVRRNPANLEARMALARAYLKEGLPSAANEQLESAYRADSTHAGVTAALAAQRHAAGRTDEALAMARRLVQRYPRHAAFLRDYGTWSGEAGRMEQAEAALSQAVRLDPTDEAATRMLQEVVNMRMSLENAMFPDELRSAKDPQFNAFLPRAVEAMEAGRWDEADSLVAWAEQTYPRLATTHWVRAGYLSRRNDLPGAIAALERCQTIAPGRPAVVGQLVRLYADSGQLAKVPPLFRAALAAAGADSVVTRQLKMMAREIGLPLN